MNFLEKITEDRKIIDLQSFGLTTSGENKPITLSDQFKRVDLFFHIKYTGTLDLTIDGDKTIIDYISSIKMMNKSGVILELEPKDIRAIATMISGSIPQDQVEKTGSLTGEAYLHLPVVINQPVSTIYIKYIGGYETSGNIFTSSGTLTVDSANCYVIGIDRPVEEVETNDGKIIPYPESVIYESLEEALGSGNTSIRKTGIPAPIKAIVIRPSADIVSSLVIKKDGKQDVLNMSSYKAYKAIQEFENDIEGFLSGKYYGAGTTLENYRILQRENGEIFITFNPERPLIAENLKFDFKTTTSGTTRILFVY